MPNRVRFDGRSGRFYEVWYAIFNDAASGDGFWIRYTLLNPSDDHPKAGGALWFAFTGRKSRSRSIAVERRFDSASLAFTDGRSVIRIGPAELRDGVMRGGFTTAEHEVSWDLSHDRGSEPHFYFDGLLRRLADRRNSVTIPNPKVRFSGRVTIDGRTVEVSDALGHHAHHWGTAQASRWLWAHCCDFEEDDSAVLELLSAPAPAGTTATFVLFRSDELTVPCNNLGGLLRNRATAGLGWWRFEGVRGQHRVVADLRVDPLDVHRFVYTAPDYAVSECWNTQVADCLVSIRGGDASKAPKVLRCVGRASAEIHDGNLERIPYRLWRREPAGT